MLTPSTKKFVWIVLMTIIWPSMNVSTQPTSGKATEVDIVLFGTNPDPIVHIQKEGIAHIIKQSPQSFSTTLSDRNLQPVKVDLWKTKVTKKDVSDALFFRGNITGKQNTIVTLTIDHQVISGLISDSQGNYTFSTEETSHNDNRLIIHQNKYKSNSHNWSCHAVTEKDGYKKYYNNKSNYKSLSTDTLGIYFVCDYELYELHGFSTSSVLSYVHDMFLQVQTIYKNENINVIIEDTHIWETPDPYDNASAESALLSFKNDIGDDYNGHFAHLLSGNSNLSGGIAFINGLCDRSKSFSYSNVDASIDPQGGYSWDVHVVAHELGHNMGSPHTHDCAWGPEGTDAIDACGAPAPECEDAPFPSEGGTIMSYCHSSPVGVNFSLGFGQEPGDLIRSTINRCHPSDGESCEEGLIITDDGTFTTGDLIAGSGASHSDPIHAKWYRYTPPVDGTIDITSCGQGLDTRLFIYTGSCAQLVEIADSDDDCFSGNGYYYASLINGLAVIAGIDIIIEWDDRWSSESFEFTFLFVPDNLPTCTNGIQDGDETGIDCGGSYCPPCQANCNDGTPLPDVINHTMDYRTMSSVNYSGTIESSAILEITSSVSVGFGEGFELKAGGQMEVDLGACN